ncbi:restriction endonuclease [Pontixanthobacter luteolus]|uniref:restriction endonuclease n=1 Tax=Pontixanthobacter luteolus TaxID=295089 RepID=UPI002302B20D|nr:restriction endonuclease [Pontixanthobacter luteolus]
MSIPDYQTLMLPVLRLAANGEIRVPAAADKIANEFGLSEAEREELLPSGKQRTLHNRIHWAKFYLGKAGLVETPERGIFRATPQGTEILQSGAAALSVSDLKTIPKFEEFYKSYTGDAGVEVDSTSSSLESSSSTPEEQIENAHDILSAALQSDLVSRILDQSPAFFERLIVELLVAMGYGGSHEDAARNLGKSGDGGVDGVIDEDRLGLDRIYVQAKRYAEKSVVGRPEVQGFVGSLTGLGATKGVFVTTSTFSAHAWEYAGGLPLRIVLLDGKRLTELMIEHDVGVRTSRTIEMKRLDEEFFDDQ